MPENNEQTEGPNPDPYWDVKNIMPDNVWSDFEGFADPKQILPLLEDPDVITRLEVWSSEVNGSLEQKFLRDMLLHYAYEMLDQGDHLVTSEEACVFLDTLVWTLQSRYWIRVTDADIEDIKKES